MKPTRKLTESERFALVLQHYGIFQPEGTYKIVCPFHGDVNPSMSINIPEAFFYCFGCGVHGSTYELLKLFNPSLKPLEIYTIMSGLEKGRGIIGGRVEYTDLSTATKSYSGRNSYKQGIKLAKDYYYNLPETNWYKPSDEVFAVKSYMHKRGYKSSTLKNSNAKATFSANYPIVFPLMENGIFRGYVMRTTDKQIEAERKYMYNTGFKRKNVLIGEYPASSIVLVVEGYLDLLAAKQLGIENVVAFLGWKASDRHIEKLKHRGIEHIICGLDNDEAGRNGYKFIKNKFEQVDRIRYPKGIKDFGDLLKQPTAAEQILQQIRQIKNI